MQPKTKGQGDSVTNAGNKRGKQIPLVGAVLLAAVTFGVGVRVGDGSISFHHSSSSSSTLPGKLDYSSVDDVYNTLRKEYDGKLDQTKLLDGMKEGMAEATGDPYTEYFTSDEYKKFDEQLNGTGFSGIGAELGLDEDKNLIVVSPISGMPADKAGLKAKDIISEIDGKSTTGFSIDEAVTKIRGKKGTDVKLKLIRNRAQTIDVTITRDDIKVPSVDSKQLDDGTGYMHISTFGDDTGDLAATQAQELKDKGVKKMVLDLRGNPGGVVDSAIKVASLWLPKGTLIMQEKRDNTVVKTYAADGNNILEGVQTVVLIDGGSASASEIVSGALHDNKAATLLGEKSYGKGVVQGIEPLQDGGELKVTIARWYRPNGQNIDKKGIDPDQKVTISDEDAAAGKDTQLEAAQAALK
jgi:carboxyl-terminal processing protease